LELVLWNGLQSCRRITPDVINIIKMLLYHDHHNPFSLRTEVILEKENITGIYLGSMEVGSVWPEIHVQTEQGEQRHRTIEKAMSSLTFPACAQMLQTTLAGMFIHSLAQWNLRLLLHNLVSRNAVGSY
jgi:hypothetical protein